MLGILGLTSGIMPFSVPLEQISVTRDLGAVALSVIFLLIFAYTWRRLARWEGAVLLSGYVLYMFLLLSGPSL